MPSADLATLSVKTYRIECSGGDEANKLIEAANRIGITSLTVCSSQQLYFLSGSITAGEVEQFTRQVLVDPVTQVASVLDAAQGELYEPLVDPGVDHSIEVMLHPGVTDSVADNLVRAAHLLGMVGLERVATGKRTLLRGKMSQDDLNKLATVILSNPVTQRFSIDQPIAAPFYPYQEVDEAVDIIPVCKVNDPELLAISSSRRLALDLKEMRAIQAHFQQEGRDPTDAELEMIAQTWSEHCSHKSFNAVIDFEGSSSSETIDGLLRSTIRAATERLNKPWVHSAFVDNAGVIAFDDNWDLAFKVETHNHPSALEPFGGANTGVGGVVRDILGVSARPIANTDVLCFGPADLPQAELLPGVLEPNRVADGVISGVEDYGNKMGIPTVNGAILYHRGYAANPLVFCGCLGILPRGSHVTDPQPGDLVIVIGGRTGRDGLRGATFSSMEMDQTTGEIAGSSVQIGHPINEKQVLEVVLRARDERLYHAITDCGAGGLSSAVGEMASQLGAKVQLEMVPLKYPGLRPWEIWLSEAQERMVLAVPPQNWPRFEQICDTQEVEATRIGTFEDNGRLQLSYGTRTVSDLSMLFLHKGMPRRALKAVWKTPANQTTVLNFAEPPDATKSLLALLAHPNIRSKEAVIRRYDHEVQGSTAVKPLVGKAGHGPGDAAVLVPLDTITGKDGTVKDSKVRDSKVRGSQRGIALSAGICPEYGDLDPYVMAWAAVDEAVRNAVAVGADPDQIALLDNFCWGNPNAPDRLGGLVRAAQGCYDAAMAYGTPFVSGKDSLNNEYADAKGNRHAIPGTLLISAIGIVPDVKRTVTMDLKAAGNVLYLVGETRAEMGGSHYALMQGDPNGTPPQPVRNAPDQMRALHRAIGAGIVQSCHDCSEGGLGVALAEMCIAGELGADIALLSATSDLGLGRDDVVLFSESLSRFVVEVRPADVQAFERALADFPCTRIGTVNMTETLRVKVGPHDVLQARVAELELAWRGSSDAVAAATQAKLNTVSAPDTSRSALRHPLTQVGPRRVIVLTAQGSNRDREAALACQLAGAEPEIVGVHQLLTGERRLEDYHMLVVPGGFSYGDDLGAGTLLAMDLQYRLKESVARFIAEGRPVLGICNGFQALVKAGLLPGSEPLPDNERPRTVTLTTNTSGHFECRWVYLLPNPHSPCLFTAGLDELIYCPVAHGEGRVAVSSSETLNTLWSEGLAPLTYVEADGKLAGYPANPNGSPRSVAGLCNPAGNVFGLMPHPENHIFSWQHPRWHRGESGLIGLRLFQNGVKYA